MPSLEDAHALDAADPLAGFRDEFAIDDDDEDRIYADGNSLGRLPLATVERLRRVVEEEWGRSLIGSWESWFDLPQRVGDLVGVEVLGARPGETVIADSTTVNLYKLAAAALGGASGDRHVIVTDAGNFPTDRFVLQGLPGAHVHTVRADPSADDVAQAIDDAPGRVALVALSHVSYFSGARLDLPGITHVAHDRGALVVWDLSHAAGAVPIDLAANDVDLAVGCTYKYLNGGPGSPAFLYVRTDLQEQLQQPIHGWFGAAEPFAMQQQRYEPAPGIGRFVSGSPSVLGLVAVEEGAAIVAKAGIGALAAKGESLTAFLLDCIDAELGGFGGDDGSDDFDIITPRNPTRRGAHVSLRHPEAWRICRALIERLGVVPDFREPDVVRLGLAPLYSRYADAWHAVQRLRTAVADRVYEDLPMERRRVT
jgi:kynureninase